MIQRKIARSIEKKELYKFIVANSDIYAAKYACDCFVENVSNMQDTLYFPLLETIIISYSRPFSANKPLGSLHKKWGIFKKDRYNLLHKRILEMRNKIIAHSDFEIRKVQIIPPYCLIPVLEQRTQNIDFGIKTQALQIESVPIIRDMCINLGQRLLKEIEYRIDALYKDRILPAEPFDLTFDENL
jgi:hypothetical protein